MQTDRKGTGERLQVTSPQFLTKKTLVFVGALLACAPALAYDFAQEFKDSPSTLCNDLMATRFVDANKDYFTQQHGMNSLNKSEIVASVQKFDVTDLGKIIFYTGQKTDAWGLSLMPSTELRRRSLVYALNFKFPVPNDAKKLGFDPLEDVETYSSHVPSNHTLNEKHVSVALTLLDRLIQDYTKNPRPVRDGTRSHDGISKNADARGIVKILFDAQSKFGGRHAISTAFCMGYPMDWPNEEGINMRLPGHEFQASWSNGHEIVEAEVSASCHESVKLTSGNEVVAHAPAKLNHADKPYTSGGGMSGGPVLDTNGHVIGIHACANGVFYSSKDALETLESLRAFLKKGGDLERVVTLPGNGRREPEMRLALVDALAIDYAPDVLTTEMLDFILDNAADD